MHAYLFSGADPMQTDMYMRITASLIIFGSEDASALQYCPDYFEYSGSISIAMLRDDIRPEIYKQTHSGRAKVVAFRNASSLSPIVQNAMLKILEEPPASTHFILTGNEHGLLPTVLSRCLVLRIGLPSVSEIASTLEGMGAERSEALKYARMSGGVTERAIRLYADGDFREMRKGALAAFISALNGAPDFKWARTKRERSDWIEANEMMLLCCHDMLRTGNGLDCETALDIADDLKKLSSVFTIGQISCIIDGLADNAVRLASNAGGGACFDRLFAILTQLANAGAKN